ncbi:MAG: murein biosynthesis integral membrane protein MurJ [Phycisphaeraceae bacterium]|nr:murein biosynthesis integral membrane protein MurJ [Phycisphaeraceae bacterium]
MTDRVLSCSPRMRRWLLGVYWLALAVSTHWPKLQIVCPLPDVPIDKLLHAAAFGLLAALLIAAMGRRLYPLAVLIALAYAPLDEITQTLVQRTLDWGDTVAGLCGIILFAAMLWTPRKVSQPSSADGEQAADASGSAFVGHAVLVAAMTFISRLTGLLRDAVVLGVMGQQALSDAFFMAFQIPNLFRRLFGEGALSAAFIPHYTQLLKRDKAAARRFSLLCIGGLLTVTAAITLLGELALGAWLSRMAADHRWRLVVELTMAMLPYMPLICAAALAGSVLQVHRRFGPPAAAPILLNLGMIGFAWWAFQIGHDDEGVAWMMAAGVLCAGLMQLAWLSVLVVRHAGVSLGLAGTGAAVRSMMVMMLPMIIGLAVFQINTFMDSLIAYGLSTEDATAQLHLFGHSFDYPILSGAVAALNGAQRVYQFPLGVFAIAIATAIFPALAHAAATDDHQSYARMLRHGLRLSMFIGLPASMGLILLRVPLVQLFFEHGAFTHDDTLRTADIMACYAAGVWAYSTTHTLTRAFYARHDSRTPLRVSLAMVGLNLTLNLTLIWPLGAGGLALSTAICGSVQTVILILLLQRGGVQAVDRSVAGSWLRTLVLTALMSAAVGALAQMTNPLTTWQALGVVLGGVGVGAVVVLGGAWISGAPETRWLLRRKVES